MEWVNWPERYAPGTTDNYVCNEAIVTGLSAAEVWAGLVDTSRWESYYGNVSQIGFGPGEGPRLGPDMDFRFTTFVYPVIARVTECVPPAPGRAGRISWTGLIEGDARNRLDVLHAWIIEDLPGGRVRVLTQESQIGQPAKEMAAARPNPMLNAHQDWIEGLVRNARQNQASH
jgi:hypothetical protein